MWKIYLNVWDSKVQQSDLKNQEKLQIKTAWIDRFRWIILIISFHYLYRKG